jgi:endonuclease/exonuclease/phosphatase family metal-dependent hydrolase
MKLISLNTWGCRITEPLFDFIKGHAESTDVFCFQEILKGGHGITSRGEIKSAYEDIQRMLPNHTGYFSEYGDGGYYSERSKDLDFKYGIACFVSNNYKQSFGQTISLYDPTKKWSDYSGRFAVGTAMSVQAGEYGIINVHGLWQESIKRDTEAKIEQSQKVLDLAKELEGSQIICGDFNLLPDTKAIQMIGAEYKDLIKEYSIIDTRSPLYTKELRYSDYVFVDKDLSVNEFSVPNVTISDHLPMIIRVQ